MNQITHAYLKTLCLEGVMLSATTDDGRKFKILFKPDGTWYIEPVHAPAPAPAPACVSSYVPPPLPRVDRSALDALNARTERQPLMRFAPPPAQPAHSKPKPQKCIQFDVKIEDGKYNVYDGAQ